MAQYDITSQVERIIALGGTEARVLGCASRVVRSGDQWTAQNRSSEAAVDMLLGEFEAAAAKRSAAEQIISKIRDGHVLYTKDASRRWLIWGREDVITPGATVTAERRDGSTSNVIITQVGPVLEKDGLRYRIAEFRAPSGTEIDPMHDLTDPGAEARRIGRSHGVNGQIWDNA